MRRTLNWLSICVALIVGGAAFTGCTIFGTTERTVAAKKFDTYKSVFTAAETAYKAFKRDCFHGQVTAKNEAAGDKAWNEFRTAYETSFRIGMDDVLAPENVLALKNQLIGLLLTL